MDQLGDRPERIRKRLEEKKREAAGEHGEPRGDSREAAGDEAYEDASDESLGDLGDVYRNETYRGEPERG
ncbi:hypothetical protein ABZ611_14770 [Streptomyces sp. NPDC007861]|uniref:hypothetical protein n=1 Tax=Streptomyces sp. NPDC007861 TaxID=3154893 RepID=UPI0033CC0AFC